MDTDTGVRVERTGGTAVVTLANPRVRNALTMTMWRDLADVVGDLDDDPAVSAVVLRGQGLHFSAGADIRDLPDDPEEFDRLHLAAEAALANATTPTIAAIRGACVGGGLELAVACDVRFAERSAVFAITAGRLGIVYPARPLWRLVDVVGTTAARRMLLGGEHFDVTWAQRVGLVGDIVANADTSALDFATLVGTRSPETTRAALRMWAGAPSRTGGTDYREGVAAFRAGRTPDFTRARVTS